MQSNGVIPALNVAEACHAGLGVTPTALKKQGRKAEADHGEAGWQAAHGGVSWRGHVSLTHQTASPPSTRQDWRKSNLVVRLVNMKRLVSRMAERLGYKIIPTWQMETYFSLRHLQRLLTMLSVDLVIDVGANAGQFHDMLRDQAGYKGRIVSFEPVPHLAQMLTNRAKSDPLWTVKHQALGASPGTVMFNVMKDTEFSSFLTPNHDDIDIFKGQNTVCERVPVDITTLDIFLMDYSKTTTSKNIYLKIDAQGFDLEVLKGAETILPSVAALQVEASVRPIYENAPNYQDMIGYLESSGYVVSGFFPNNDGHFPQLIEFDCYMIRRKFVV